MELSKKQGSGQHVGTYRGFDISAKFSVDVFNPSNQLMRFALHANGQSFVPENLTYSKDTAFNVPGFFQRVVISWANLKHLLKPPKIITIKS